MLCPCIASYCPAVALLFHAFPCRCKALQIFAIACRINAMPMSAILCPCYSNLFLSFAMRILDTPMHCSAVNHFASPTRSISPHFLAAAMLDCALAQQFRAVQCHYSATQIRCPTVSCFSFPSQRLSIPLYSLPPLIHTSPSQVQVLLCYRCATLGRRFPWRSQCDTWPSRCYSAISEPSHFRSCAVLCLCIPMPG